jgi:hypothetical protein
MKKYCGKVALHWKKEKKKKQGPGAVLYNNRENEQVASRKYMGDEESLEKKTTQQLCNNC